MTTPAARLPVDGFAAATMLLLCAIWGAQQVAIKLAAADVAPTLQLGVRSGLSAVLLAAFAAWRGERLPWRETWRPGLLVGALFAVEFVFIGEGLRRTTASHFVVFLYTAPVFTALGLHLVLPAERLRPRHWLGVAVAFSGIALAFGGGLGRAATRTALLGDALGVLAGAAWGATTVVVRASALAEAPPALTLLWQLASAFVTLVPAALASGQGRVALTATAVTSVLFQGVVVSFASYLTWFWLLRRYLATRLAVFSFMTPIFGVTAGVLVLGDPLGGAFAGGAVLVVAGIAIVSGAR